MARLLCRFQTWLLEWLGREKVAFTRLTDVLNLLILVTAGNTGSDRNIRSTEPAIASRSNLLVGGIVVLALAILVLGLFLLRRR